MISAVKLQRILLALATLAVFSGALAAHSQGMPAPAPSPATAQTPPPAPPATQQSRILDRRLTPGQRFGCFVSKTRPRTARES